MRVGIHKVGLVASLAGAASLVLLSFGRVRPFRLATGEPLALWQALPAILTAVPLVIWLVVLVISGVEAPARRAATVRGLLASALIAVLPWLSGIAADRALAGEPAIARYSVGGGPWLSLFAAFALLMGSRREVGPSSPAGLAIAMSGPLAAVGLIVSGRLSKLGIAAEYRNISDDFWLWVGQHIAYAGSAMLVAIVLGTLLGILAFRRPRLARPVFAATSVVQTIPGLAMVGLLAVPLGYLSASIPAVNTLGIGVLGWAPVVIALTLYALLMIVRNTYAGLASVPAAAVDAGRGMGMGERQLLARVQLPLASPVLLSGTRTALQQTIGSATLAYFVAAGGLGRPTFGGVSQQAFDLVLLGSAALVALALIADGALKLVEMVAVPHGVGGRR